MEYKFNNDWSVFTEFGAIIPARLSYSEVNSSEYSGFRIKGGLRKRIYKAFFMELNYYHRRVEHGVTTDFFRFNRLYIEEMNFTVNNVMNGLAIIAGVEIKMGNRWVWDIGGGVGPGVQDRIFSELPQDVEEIDRSFLWTGINFRRNNIKNEFFPVIVMNARLKYRIF